MNERIKKLKEQATSYTWNGNDVTEELDEQKFAELIVGQCASIVCLYRRDNMQDKAIADTLEDAYREIKLSFGLKP